MTTKYLRPIIKNYRKASYSVRNYIIYLLFQYNYSENVNIT